jgi:hypothetical protein
MPPVECELHAIDWSRLYKISGDHDEHMACSGAADRLRAKQTVLQNLATKVKQGGDHHEENFQTIVSPPLCTLRRQKEPWVMQLS